MENKNTITLKSTRAHYGKVITLNVSGYLTETEIERLKLAKQFDPMLAKELFDLAWNRYAYPDQYGRTVN